MPAEQGAQSKQKIARIQQAILPGAVSKRPLACSDLLEAPALPGGVLVDVARVEALIGCLASQNKHLALRLQQPRQQLVVCAKLSPEHIAQARGGWGARRG